jgi:hypothetical protein
MEADDTPLPSRLLAANDSAPPSIDAAKVDAAPIRIARLIGRQIARETFDAGHAANDNDAPPGT